MNFGNNECLAEREIYRLSPAPSLVSITACLGGINVNYVPELVNMSDIEFYNNVPISPTMENLHVTEAGTVVNCFTTSDATTQQFTQVAPDAIIENTSPVPTLHSIENDNHDLISMQTPSDNHDLISTQTPSDVPAGGVEYQMMENGVLRISCLPAIPEYCIDNADLSPAPSVMDSNELYVYEDTWGFSADLAMVESVGSRSISNPSIFREVDAIRHTDRALDAIEAGSKRERTSTQPASLENQSKSKSCGLFQVNYQHFLNKMSCKNKSSIFCRLVKGLTCGNWLKGF